MDNILSPYWLTRQFINLLSSNVNMIHVSWLNFLPVIVRVLKVQYLYGNRATWNVFLYCRPNDLLGSVPMFMKLGRKEGLSICDVGLTSDFYLLIYFLWFSWIWIFFFFWYDFSKKARHLSSSNQDEKKNPFYSFTLLRVLIYSNIHCPTYKPNSAYYYIYIRL